MNSVDDGNGVEEPEIKEEVDENLFLAEEDATYNVPIQIYTGDRFPGGQDDMEFIQFEITELNDEDVKPNVVLEDPLLPEVVQKPQNTAGNRNPRPGNEIQEKRKDVPNEAALPDPTSLTLLQPGPSSSSYHRVHRVERRQLLTGKETVNQEEPQQAPKCVFCPRRIADRVEMENHTKENFVGADFALTCQIEELKEHMNVHKSFICPVCSQEFVDMMQRNDQWNDLMVKHNIQLPIPCNHCPETFGTVNLLKLHMLLHDEKAGKDVDVRCVICKDFGSNASITNAISHMKECQGDYRIVCSLCSTVFGTEEDLNVHMAKKHATARQKCLQRMRTCSLCGKLFASQARMLDHLKEEVRSILGSVEPESVAKPGSQRTVELPETIEKVSEEQENIQGIQKTSEDQEDLKHVHVTKKQKKKRLEESLSKEPDVPIRCHICDKKDFKQRSELLSHLRVVHGEAYLQDYLMALKRNGNVYKCIKCLKSFVNQQYLKEHVRVCEGQPSVASVKLFECSICWSSYTSLNNLIYHMKVHSHEQNDCLICTTEFSERHELIEHMNVHKVGPRNPSEDAVEVRLRKCYLCLKIYRNRRRLLMHMKYFHNARYQCAHCSKRLSRYRLLPHIRTHLKSRQVYKCKDCEVVFSSKQLLRDHLPYDAMCRVCNEVFCTLTRRHEHERDVHDMVRKNSVTLRKKYKCPICSKFFAAEKGLKSHLNFHSDPTSKQCLYCPQVFMKDSSLRTHMNRSHTRGSGVVCPICKKHFHSSYIRNHMETHIQKCGVCFLTFTTVQDLFGHLQENHNITMSQENTKGSSVASVYRQGTQSQSERYPYECSICFARFRTGKLISAHKERRLGELNEHMKVHEEDRHDNKEVEDLPEGSSEEILLTTPVAEDQKPTFRTFEDESELEGHGTTVDEELDSFKCGNCKMAFTTEDDLRVHLLEHTSGQSYQCTHCYKTFPTKDLLECHMQLHKSNGIADPAPQEQVKDRRMVDVIPVYACEHCSAIFVEEPKLQKHLDVSHHICPYCPAAFPVSYLGNSQFDKHIKEHKDNLKFKCSPCGKTFKEKSKLLRHLLVVHRTMRTEDFIVETSRSDSQLTTVEALSEDSDVEIIEDDEDVEDIPEVKVEETEIIEETYEYEGRSSGMDIEPEVVD
ncbi:hypothetical protein DMENIID0001_006280 [Sergentomyia squamirostris]